MISPACSDRRPAWRRRGLRAHAVALLVACAIAAPHARAVDPFVVRDIRVEGVQRTEAGTIFSYLPIKVGERVDDEKLSAAVKALYATGFFRDVRLEREGDVLVVAVQERPTISTLSFVGYLALISISLGVLNLLPIPLLDGGHLLYYLAEIVLGRPVSDRAFEVGQRIGMALLAVLMTLALVNDFSRLF